MRSALVAIMLALVAAVPACAQDSATQADTADFGDTTTVSYALHYVRLSEPYKIGTCHIRIGESRHGKLYPSTDAPSGTYMYRNVSDVSHIVEWGFPTHCHYGASRKDIYRLIRAKPSGKKWIDLGTTGKLFKPKQHFKLIRFSGKNWKGIGVAVDQIYYAPPELRSRFFNFCLVEDDGPQVLCGRTQIRGVTQPESESRLPKIMAVLKTIVFVDSPNSPATSSTSSHDH